MNRILKPSNMSLGLNAGQELGQELVTNGTFDTDVSGWSAYGSSGTGSLTWSAGKALLTITSGWDVGLRQDSLGAIIGPLYQFKIDYDKTGLISVGSMVISVGGNNFSIAGGDPDVGSLDEFIIMINTPVNISARTGGGGDKTGESFTIDNVSLKEVI